MHLTCLIPTRGKERAGFLAHCLRLLNTQTRKPDAILVVDHAPTSNEIDITQRYRIGYQACKNTDLIAFIEDDDYYAPEYLETMLNAYNGADIMGLNQTPYYHIFERKYFYQRHTTRAAAMSTFIKPNLDINWPKDSEPFTDLHIWEQIKKRHMVAPPHEGFAIGIKHGTTLTGASYHNTRMERYRFHDPKMKWLKEHTTKESFEFYRSIGKAN